MFKGDQNMSASYEQTVSKLLELGFIRTDLPEYFHTPGDCSTVPGIPVAECRVYRSSAGHYCVDVDNGSFMAPVVWHGAKATWDTSNTTDEFVAWMGENYPGWR